MTFRHAALRKVAIVIDSLDPAEADAMLDQFPSEQSARIRLAVMELENVGEQERRDALRQFLQRSGRMASPAAIEDSLELGGTLATRFSAPSPSPAPKQERMDGAMTDVFGFLQQANDEALSALLQGEHPQTSAVVISQLPPKRAMMVLRRFSDSMRADVLRRVWTLGETDPQILQEVAHELQLLLKESLGKEPSDAGRQAVQSLLNAADDEERRRMLEWLGWEPDAPASTRFADEHAPFPASESTSEEEPVASADEPAFEQPTVFERPWFVEFDELAKLDDASLANLLQKARPVAAVLALAGASQQMSRKVFGRLSPRDDAALTRQLTALEPFPLRDIALAQAELVGLANQLADTGEVSPPASRRLAAAA